MSDEVDSESDSSIDSAEELDLPPVPVIQEHKHFKAWKKHVLTLLTFLSVGVDDFLSDLDAKEAILQDKKAALQQKIEELDMIAEGPDLYPDSDESETEFDDREREDFEDAREAEDRRDEHERRLEDVEEQLEKIETQREEVDDLENDLPGHIKDIFEEGLRLVGRSSATQTKLSFWDVPSGKLLEVLAAVAFQSTGQFGNVSLVGRAGDDGIDILMNRYDPPEKVIVQCKQGMQFSSGKGPSIVREALGTMVLHDVSSMFLVTSAEVSTQQVCSTIERATSKGFTIEVIHLQELVSMFEQNRIDLDVEVFRE